MMNVLKSIIHPICRPLFETLEIGLVRTTRHSTIEAIKHFNNKPITAIEIGVYKGLNSKSILRNLNIKKLYLVDPFKEYEDYLNSENNKNQRHLDKVFLECKKRLRKWNNKIVFIKKFSDAAVTDVPDADFIYIDGNHEYQYVLKDIENYWKKVKKNGILAGHDINWGENHPVLKAVKDFCNKQNLDFYCSGECWWIKKQEHVLM